jgi:hypothetical protein
VRGCLEYGKRRDVLVVKSSGDMYVYQRQAREMHVAELSKLSILYASYELCLALCSFLC